MRHCKLLKYQLRRRLEKLDSRIIFLPRHEQILVRIFLNGCSFSQIAYMAGVCSATVARRLAKIVMRLSKTNYAYALRNNKTFTAEQMKIIRNYFLKGHSMTNIAKKNNCSRHYVRKTIRQVEQLVRR